MTSLPEPSPLPATANKGHLGQLVHLAQLHSARASLWRVPSFQSLLTVKWLSAPPFFNSQAQEVKFRLL
ncbi:hypothetical protein KY285_024579 [Solanum tuberosum]|nr:hypothetical protein KY285_024579 [Solanum tuberosum]